MRWSSRLLAAVVACAVAGATVSTTAHAAEPVDVENLIRQGNELRQKGRDHAALPLFQRAYDLARTPRTAAQLGLAEFAMGYWLSAEKHLVEALASPRHPWVAKAKPQLEQSLAEVRANIGELEVIGNPPGAEVLVNGRVEGILPMPEPVRVPDGMAQVAARAPGYDEKLLTVKITGGKRERVDLTLVPARGPQAAAARAAGPGSLPGRRRGRVSGTPEAMAAGEAVDGPAPSGAPGWVRPVAWVASGVAVLALGVAAYGYVDMKTNMDSFNRKRDLSNNNMQACSLMFTTPTKYGAPGCKSLYDASVAAQRLALIGLQVGALMGAAAVVGFLWSAGGDDQTSLGALPSGAIAGIDGDGGVSAGWRFRF